MTTRKRGRKRLMYPAGPPTSTPIFAYHSPGVSFDTDNMTEEEITALSSEVKVYKTSELEKEVSTHVQKDH
jgi:hypothetical protein